MWLCLGKKASLTEGALELQMNITESQMTGGGERGSRKSSRQHAPALREWGRETNKNRAGVTKTKKSTENQGTYCTSPCLSVLMLIELIKPQWKLTRPFRLLRLPASAYCMMLLYLILNIQKLCFCFALFSRRLHFADPWKGSKSSKLLRCLGSRDVKWKRAHFEVSGKIVSALW